MSAIVITDLSKNYGEVCAVSGVSLEIAQGELFSLLGVNGAGKTTLIKMLSGLTPPCGGDAFILGESIRKNSPDTKLKLNISPQETAVAENLTVCENLQFIAGIYGQDKSTARQNAVEISSRFGLQSVFTKRAKTLSGGMKRRLSIAMALITNPQILFLDEPTLGLDVFARRELWSLILSLKGKVTIILTTHYLEEAESLSDRVGIMAKGKLIAVDTVEQLTRQTSTSKLEEAFISLAGGAL